MGADRLTRAASEGDKAARRLEVLDAAKKVFAAEGFHRARMSDIARCAGVSYGVVYWYFDTKHAVFDAVIEAEVEGLNRAVLDVIAAAGSVDADEALLHAVRVVLQRLGDDPAAARLLLENGGMTADSGRRFLSGLEAIVEDGQRTGRIRQGPPGVIAAGCGALVAAVVERRLVRDDGLEVEDAAELVVALLLHGLRPD